MHIIPTISPKRPKSATEKQQVVTDNIAKIQPNIVNPSKITSKTTYSKSIPNSPTVNIHYKATL